MPFHTHRLPNGLQLLGETIPSSRSVSVGFYVMTGSRDETAAEQASLAARLASASRPE